MKAQLLAVAHIVFQSCAATAAAHESGAFTTSLSTLGNQQQRAWTRSSSKMRPLTPNPIAFNNSGRKTLLEISSSSSTNEPLKDNSDNNTVETKNEEENILDNFGQNALLSIQLLARAAGSADSKEYLKYTPVDSEYVVDNAGFNDGAYGIAGDRHPVATRRSRMLQWQRNKLGIWAPGRRPPTVLMATDATEDVTSDESVGRTLVNALPSSPPTTSTIIDNNNDNNAGSSYNKGETETTVITKALSFLERDMSFLDEVASLEPQLSGTEVSLLLGAVVASGIGPIAFPGTSVTEVLAPAAAAFAASITIGSEYIGRVAVADGKEIAANAIICAAEAEAQLAKAERVKAITPLCVGVGATCAAFSILAPTLLDALGLGVVSRTELFLLCPLISALSAAVCNLALEETRNYANTAISIGRRRFSKSTKIGKRWLSTAEQVQNDSRTVTERWYSFGASVLPAPLIGALLGGPSLGAKCILITALAAAQSAYYLADAEAVIARAQDAVALKARSAAVCDAYANQGVRNSAILPFTSALSAFCAAATAATVELPFVETIASLYGTVGEIAVVSTFPILSSIFAAAAAVSKARCEVDAEAAAQSAGTIALDYNNLDGSGGDDPFLKPIQTVVDLVRLSWKSFSKVVTRPFRRILRTSRNVFGWKRSSGDGYGEGLA